MSRNAISKKLSNKGFEPAELTAIQNIFGALIFLSLIFLTGQQGLILRVGEPSKFIALIAFTALLSLIGGVLQYKVFKNVEYSKASLGYIFMPVITSLMAFIFLSEKLSIIDLFGILITTFGMFCLYLTNMNFKKLIKQPNRVLFEIFKNKYFIYLILNLFIFAIMMTFQKKVLNETNPLSAFFLLYAFVALYSIKPAKNIFKQRTKLVSNKSYLLIFIITAVLAFSFGLLSYKFLPLGVSDAFRGLTTPIVIILGSIAFNENTKFKAKFASSIIITLGILILSLY